MNDSEDRRVWLKIKWKGRCKDAEDGAVMVSRPVKVTSSIHAVAHDTSDLCIAATYLHAACKPAQLSPTEKKGNHCNN